MDKEKIVDRFISLTAINSLSYDEREMANYIKNAFIRMGIFLGEDGAFKKYSGTAGNLYGFVKGSIPGSPVLFSAHMDTVGPGIDKKAVISGDIIKSDGTTVLGADDCAGITEIIEALQYIKDNNIPHRDIEFLFTMGEEVFSKGSALFDYSRLRSEYAYVLDLSGGAGIAALCAPSIITFSVNIKGKSAHAGFEPENGINAIAAAARAVADLRQGHTDADSTLNIGMIQGGTAMNIVPEACSVRGEIRSLDHEKALSLTEHVKETFIQACREYGAECDFTYNTEITAYSADKNSRSVQHFEKACKDLDISTQYIKTFGGSDNNNIVKYGIDGIVISCGMENVHSCDEYIKISELVKCTEIVFRLMTT